MVLMIVLIFIGISLLNMSVLCFSVNCLMMYLSICEFNDDIVGSGSEVMVFDI